MTERAEGQTVRHQIVKAARIALRASLTHPVCPEELTSLGVAGYFAPCAWCWQYACPEDMHVAPEGEIICEDCTHPLWT